MSASMPAGQLPLALEHSPGMTRDDLVVSASNRAAVDLVDRWPDWPSRVAIIVGPKGSGKTHLASIWSAKVGATLVNAGAVRQEVIDRATTGAIAIDPVVPGAIDETGLFHLVNTVRAHGTWLFMTSERRPSAWDLRVPDLESRLNAATLVEIGDPDDLLLMGVMTKLFADRQLAVPPQVLTFLASRMERSLPAAIAAVEAVDRLSLAGKQKVTRLLAARALRENL